MVLVRFFWQGRREHADRHGAGHSASPPVNQTTHRRL
jgi:hypothetical protein